MKHLYKNGLPFGQKLAENLDDQIKRIEGKKASLIIIDGGVGEGKTTLAVHVADYIQGEKIQLNKEGIQYAMGGPDFTKKLRLCHAEGRAVCIYDEAGDFNKRGALTKFNAMLNRTFETYRAFKIIVIVCLPTFNVLDNDIFDKNIPRLLIHCTGRGENYGNFYSYSLYRMMYVRDKMKKLVVKSFAYNLVQANFYGQFLDIEPSRSKALDLLSTAGKTKELMAAEIKMDGLITYQEISFKLSRSLLWCRLAISKLKIKPKKVIGQKKFFDSGVIDVLSSFMDEGGSVYKKKEAKV